MKIDGESVREHRRELPANDLDAIPAAFATEECFTAFSLTTAIREIATRRDAKLRVVHREAALADPGTDQLAR